MKKLIQFLLQHLLGFKNYLFVFALYIYSTLKRNRREGDFLYFLSILADNSVILDIGANIGVMTTYLARKYPFSQVLAFEPVPENILTIKRMVNFFKLTNVKIYECALGNEEGEAHILLPLQKRVKMQGLSHIEGSTGNDPERGITYPVIMHRLDQIAELEATEILISGIKIDVENYEYQVLKGAENLLRKHKPVIYAELWDNQNRADCFELLQGMDYQVKVLIKGNLATFDPLQHQKQNFFFVPAAG